MGEKTRAIFAEYGPETIYLLVVQYPDFHQAEAAHDSFIAGFIPEAAETGRAALEDGTWISVVQEKEYLIIALGAPSEDAAIRLTEACRHRMLNSGQ